MVKLTVLYNLPEGADHEDFLKWRTGEHQSANEAMPGVVRTDFYVARDSRLGPPKYRYITEVWYRTMADLEHSFFSDATQEKLAHDTKRLADPVFLISEETVASGTLP